MQTSRVSFRSPDTMAATKGYSHVAEVRGGKLVFIAGQIAINESGQVVGKGNYRLQAEQVFANLGKALKSAGASFDDLVKLTVYIVDAAHAQEVREVRERFINHEHPPTNTAVQVAALMSPDLLLEVDAVASTD
jgi:enamine deaminase RidA (YjgF/YER057c/UK114 family)